MKGKFGAAATSLSKAAAIIAVDIVGAFQRQALSRRVSIAQRSGAATITLPQFGRLA